MPVRRSTSFRLTEDARAILLYLKQRHSLSQAAVLEILLQAERRDPRIAPDTPSA